MSSIQLDKIKPDFRYLADLLCFSNRMDIDLSNFNALLQANKQEHINYLTDRLAKCFEIAWENGDEFWNHRLSFLFSLNDRFISRYLERNIERRMIVLTKSKKDIHPKYDLAYAQFLAYCNVRNLRKDNLTKLKQFFIELSSQVKITKLIGIIYNLVPILFKSIDEYAETISRNIIHDSNNFNILQELDRQEIIFDKSPIIQLAKEILLEKPRGDKNIRAFFAIINNAYCLKQLRLQYRLDNRKVLLEFLSNCSYQILEEHHMRNIRNILMLDSVVADSLAIIYAEKLYSRKSGHKKANADRLIRLMKTFPQISHKKILAYLSSQNKMSDIKYILVEFPALRKLAAFV